MRKTWKKAGAIVLIGGLTVSGAGYVWADEKAKDPIDLSHLGKTEVIEPVIIHSDQVIMPNKQDDPKNAGTIQEMEIPKEPVGTTHKAANLVALEKNYEKVQNPTAKAAILRNIERTGAKDESRALESDLKEQREALKAEYKEKHEALKEKHKDVKEKWKTEKNEQKAEKNQLKEKRKIEHKKWKDKKKYENKNDKKIRGKEY